MDVKCDGMRTNFTSLTLYVVTKTKPAQIVSIKYRELYGFFTPAHSPISLLCFFSFPVIDILHPEVKRRKCTSLGASTSDHAILLTIIGSNIFLGRLLTVKILTKESEENET